MTIHIIIIIEIFTSLFREKAKQKYLKEFI